MEKEEKIRKDLSILFEKKDIKIEDLNEIHCLIEDDLEQGYNVRDYLLKYNELVRNFNYKRD